MLNISNPLKNAILLLLVFLLWACAHQAIVSPEDTQAIYTVKLAGNSLVNRFAPALLAYEYQNQQNRIGMPRARCNTSCYLRGKS